MNVQYMDHMGSDLTVVNAARVSFDKESLKFNNKDEGLVHYLAEHHHWLPFRHPTVMFRCKAPIFVARQAVKHQVGMSWSEVSRRYVDSPPEFYTPEVWRKRASDKKQGSSDETVEYITKHDGWYKDPYFDPTECPIGNHHTTYSEYSEEVPLDVEYKYHCVDALHLYEDMINSGVAPEMARMVLPQSMYTEFVWTGTLLSWAHFVKQRTEGSSQQEIQEFAKMFVDHFKRLYPVSWEALMENYQP